MPQHYISITPHGKLRTLDALSITAAEGLDLTGQIREIIGAQHGLLGGIAQRTITSADGSFLLHQLTDDERVAEHNRYAEGIVEALDGTTEEIRGAVVFTATTSAGLSTAESSLLIALYDAIADRL